MECAICGLTLALASACRQAHPDHCHSCYDLSLAASHERQEHLAPETPLVLTPRDVQALVRYRIHRQAVLGTGPCRPLVREDD